MAISHITDHYDLAVARLPMVYRDKPRYLAWLAAYCDKIQEIEDVTWDVLVDRLLQNGPTGDLLAKIGAIVGQPDITGNDTTYLLCIQARILANRSDGRRRDLIRVTQALWPLTAPPTVWVFQFSPANVMVIPQSATVLDPYVSAESFVGPATGVGITLSYVWSPSAPSATIVPASVHASGFAAAPPVTTPDITSGQYTGSTHHGAFAAGPPPASTGGGVLAGVIPSLVSGA